LRVAVKRDEPKAVAHSRATLPVDRIASDRS
jgi:hypothetical protein